MLGALNRRTHYSAEIPAGFDHAVGSDVLGRSNHAEFAGHAAGTLLFLGVHQDHRGGYLSFQSNPLGWNNVLTPRGMMLLWDGRGELAYPPADFGRLDGRTSTLDLVEGCSEDVVIALPCDVPETPCLVIVDEASGIDDPEFLASLAKVKPGQVAIFPPSRVILEYPLEEGIDFTLAPPDPGPS